MRRLLFLSVLFLFSCKNKEQEIISSQIIEADIVLENSQKHFDTAVLVYRQADSAAKKQVTKIVKEIVDLNNKIEMYDQVLKSQKVVNEKVIYRIDTVYIETKKNFWGKEKTNTLVKSDSLVTEKTDTLNQN